MKQPFRMSQETHATPATPATPATLAINISRLRMKIRMWSRHHPGNPVCDDWSAHTRHCCNLRSMFDDNLLNNRLSDDEVNNIAREIVEKLVNLGQHRLFGELLPANLWEEENYRSLLMISPRIGNDYFASFPHLQDTQEFQRQLKWFQEQGPYCL